MIRSVLSRGTRLCSAPHRRHFHSTPKYRSGSGFEDFVEAAAAKCLPFHDLFHHVHNLTGLPLVVSIPLATILVRSLVTPFRYHYDCKRLEQQALIPKLDLAAMIVKKQGENRIAVKMDNIEQNEQWKQNQWYTKRQELIKHHPLAKPTSLMSPDSRSDITNIGAMALVTINTSAILSLNHTDPSRFELDMLEGIEMPLSVCVVALAMVNTAYYNHMKSSKNAKITQPTFSMVNPLRWSDAEVTGTIVVVLPMCAGLLLYHSPLAVILSALSNSVYTLLERRLIDNYIGTKRTRMAHAMS